ncbi:MAG: hypothetical protein WCL08_06540 [Verrucomicrobiota bacterium]
MRFLITFLATSLLFFTQHASARIGETPQQCIERYGKPTKVTERGLLFTQGRIKIFVTFSEGKADGLFIQKLAPATTDKAIPISENEIEQFLICNGCKSKWQFTTQLPDGDVIWMTENLELTAMYSQTTCSIQIYTKDSIGR